MYNKYIGNTGKFTRVEDYPGSGTHQAHSSAVPHAFSHAVSPPPPVHQPDRTVHAIPPRLSPDMPPSERSAAKNKPLFGGLGSGLSSLLGGHGSSGGLLGGLGNGLKGLTGIFDHLPFGLDIGDILLFLLLFFFFIESGDEEFIIILAVVAFNLFKER